MTSAEIGGISSVLQMSTTINTLIAEALDIPIMDVLRRNNIPSPAMTSLNLPASRSFDSLRLKSYSSSSLSRSKSSPPAAESTSISLSSFLPAQHELEEPDEEDDGFQLIGLPHLHEPSDFRLMAVEQLHGQASLQRSYMDFFCTHVLLNKSNSDHDDMLFYIPFTWPSSLKPVHTHTDQPSLPMVSNDFLIVQRNVASTLSTPPNLPNIDWVMSVWLNIIMQHRYEAKVTLNVSHSACVVKSYPVFANPYHIDTGSHAVTCSFPFIFFTLAENNGTLASDSKLFLSLSCLGTSGSEDGVPVPKIIAEITLSHSICLDQMRHAPSKKSSLSNNLFLLMFPIRRRRRSKTTRQFVIDCGRGISQISLQRSFTDSQCIEYTVQTLRIHILDVIAQLLL